MIDSTLPVVWWPLPSPSPVMGRPKHMRRKFVRRTIHATSFIQLRLGWMVVGPVGLAAPLIVHALTDHYLPEIHAEYEMVRLQEEYAAAQEVWAASLKMKRIEVVENSAGLERVRRLARDGEWPPFSEMLILPPYGEKVRPVLEEAHSLLMKQKIEQLDTAIELVDIVASAAFMASLSDPIVAASMAPGLLKDLLKAARERKDYDKEELARKGKVIAKAAITKSKQKKLSDFEFSKFRGKESAPIIWEFARNGVNVIDTKDGTVRLRWGEYNDDDVARWLDLQPHDKVDWWLKNPTNGMRLA